MTLKQFYTFTIGILDCTMCANIFLCLLLFASTFTLGLTSVTCDTYKPKKGSNAVCTCVSPNIIQWFAGITSLTSCSTTAVCTPLPAGYNFQVDNSNTNVKYQMTIQNYAYSNCAEYTCQDIVTSAEEKMTLSISDFDKSSIVALEPGAETSGQISITTGCVIPPDDIEITWYKITAGVPERCREEKFTADVSLERSTCTNTCGTLEDKKVVSGFTHTEYDEEKDGDFVSVEVEYRVVVSHKSYTDAADIFTWTSAKYHLKGNMPCTTISPTTVTTKNTNLPDTTSPTTPLSTAKSSDKETKKIIIGASVAGVVLVIIVVACSIYIYRGKSKRRSNGQLRDPSINMNNSGFHHKQ